MDIYETSDTALAAWLISNQIKLSSIDKLSNPVIFKFDAIKNAELNDLIFAWNSTIAEGNCYQFYKTYRSLIHNIKGDGSGRS